MTCVACGSSVEEVFSLGEQALANEFAPTQRQAVALKKYPLGLSECGACGWMQLSEGVAPELLFGGEYPYRTLELPGWVMEVAEGNPGFVVEAGSNDGLALSMFRGRGWRVLGVDPAHNMVEEARARGVTTWERYFDVGCAREIVAEHGRADVFMGRHVFAHVPDPGAFLDAVGVVLKDEGVAYIEVPSGEAFVEERLVDTLYHEHRSVIRMGPMMRLLNARGFHLLRVTLLGIHGGSKLYQFQKGEPVFVPGDEEPVDWEAFRADVEENRGAFQELLEAWKKAGRKVCGYTAPAKGNVWMQFCGVTTEDIPWVADWTPEKIGKFCPGTGVPVVEPLTLEREDVDEVVVFAWNWLPSVASTWKHRGHLVKPYGWARPMGAVR